jgi:dihydropteroate synthase
MPETRSAGIPHIRVVRWPAPPAYGVDGVFGVKVGGLAAAARDALADAARRAGLWIGESGEATIVSGPLTRLWEWCRADAGEVGSRVDDVLRRFLAPPRILEACGHAIDLSSPLIVGVLNATPDSFFDRGRYFDRAAALARADEMVGEGADLVEVGGESARPGPPVSAGEEMRRVVPLVQALVARLCVPVTVDTRKPEVARQAIRAGAVLVNDISGLADPRMAEVAAESGAALVVMHIQGRPKVRQPFPRYESVVDDVYTFLEERTAAARAAGVPPARLVIDPGFSFGKTPRHDLELLRGLGEFRSLGYPIYLATSRKNYIRDLLGLPIHDLLEGTAAAVAYGVAQGARLVRTHDVRFMARLVRMTRMIAPEPDDAASPGPR